MSPTVRVVTVLDCPRAGCRHATTLSQGCVSHQSAADPAGGPLRVSDDRPLAIRAIGLINDVWGEAKAASFASTISSSHVVTRFHRYRPTACCRRCPACCDDLRARGTAGRGRWKTQITHRADPAFCANVCS